MFLVQYVLYLLTLFFLHIDLLSIKSLRVHLDLKRVYRLRPQTDVDHGSVRMDVRTGSFFQFNQGIP